MFRPMHAVVPVLALMLGLLPGTEAQAQWKWRDANGQIHYADHPPPASVPDRNVLSRGGAGPTPLRPAPAAGQSGDDRSTTPAADASTERPAGSSAGAIASRDVATDPAAAGALQQPAPQGRIQSAAERLATLRKQQAEKEAAQRKADEQRALEEKVAQWCESLRARARMLESGMRMGSVDASGAQTWLPDEERETQLLAVRRDLQERCSGN